MIRKLITTIIEFYGVMAEQRQWRRALHRELDEKGLRGFYEAKIERERKNQK